MSAADFGHARLLLAQEKPPVILDAGGWPSSLHIGAIAALQTGHIVDHATRMPRYEAWCSALTYATRANEALYFEDLEYDREPWVADGIERGFRVITAAWIAAADLARWMQSNDEEIGPLLALWFKARGVALPPNAAAQPSTAPECTPATYIRMSEADLLERMPLPKFINVPCAAQILGSGTNQVMERIELGYLRCWSHSTQWGLCSFDDRHGVSIEKPYLTPETNPSDVEVASKDILKSWCMAMEAFPEDSVEDVSARALKRYSALIEKARQGTGAASTPAIRLEDVDSFERLCQYRQQFAHLESQKRPPWTPKERCFLLQRHEDGVSIAGMARAFGLKSEGSIKRQLAQAKKERKKAQDAAAPANQNPPQNAFQMVAKTLATP